MKSKLSARLSLLEARPEFHEPATFRYGWLVRLPEQQAESRRIVTVIETPTVLRDLTWGEYAEKRPTLIDHGNS